MNITYLSGMTLKDHAIPFVTGACRRSDADGKIQAASSVQLVQQQTVNVKGTVLDSQESL